MLLGQGVAANKLKVMIYEVLTGGEDSEIWRKREGEDKHTPQGKLVAVALPISVGSA